MILSSTQVKHAYRYANQWLFKTPVAVIGGYHGGNLGDMALGKSVTTMLSSKGIESGLQTIYNLDKWPKSPFAIVGGGAVGYNESLKYVAERYKDNYDKVSLLGVDFMEDSYQDDCLKLIQQAAFVSGRSEAQANRLAKLTGRKDIVSHPDIAFSLLKQDCARFRAQKDQKLKKLLVNVLPLYANIANGVILPAERYKSERPTLFNNFLEMHASYKKVVRQIVSKALDEGFIIETIPFTPHDNLYGRLILEGLPVTHSKYFSNPLKMLKKIAEADCVIATRFHATIFALKTGAKLFPIAYATKNELMLQDLGVPSSHFLSTEDLANGISDMPKPISIIAGKIEQLEKQSSAGIEASINALNIN